MFWSILFCLFSFLRSSRKRKSAPLARNSIRRDCVMLVTRFAICFRYLSVCMSVSRPTATPCMCVCVCVHLCVYEDRNLIEIVSRCCDREARRSLREIPCLCPVERAHFAIFLSRFVFFLLSFLRSRSSLSVFHFSFLPVSCVILWLCFTRSFFVRGGRFSFLKQREASLAIDDAKRCRFPGFGRGSKLDGESIENFFRSRERGDR